MTEDSAAIKELKADFKRIYIDHFGVDAWNQAIILGSLPEWLGYSKFDSVDLTKVKSLQERLYDECVNLIKAEQFPCDHCYDCENKVATVRSFLEDYRKKIQQEPSTPDVINCFYQAIDEIEALLNVNFGKVEKK
jgi:hypothetical protein